MIRLRWAIAALFGLQLGGCAYLETVEGDLNHKLDGWVAQREYDKALAVLNYVRPGHPQYTELMDRRKSIQEAADAYATEAAEKAASLARNGEMAEAHALYREALRLTPDDDTLRNAYEVFRAGQAEQVDRLNRELLVTRAEWLTKALPLHRALVETDPYDLAESRYLHELESESRQVTSRLVAEGRSALERQDIKTASLLLPLASQLDPASEVASLEELRAAQAERSRQARTEQARATARKRRQEVQALKLAFEEARAEARLREAHEVALRLVELDAADAEITRVAEELDRVIRETVQARLDEGTSLYSRGRFEEALAVWRVAEELDPGNEQVRANIKRASRVINRLEELSSKQPGQDETELSATNRGRE